jgi:hypothetical protein
VQLGGALAAPQQLQQSWPLLPGALGAAAALAVPLLAAGPAQALDALTYLDAGAVIPGELLLRGPPRPSTPGP